MSGPLLETRAVAKSYGSVVALRSVDLEVQPGEIHALLGANGAGKSTLVKILAGVVAPDRGEIRVSGSPISPRRPSDAAAAGLATVFQDPALVPHLTISENLHLTEIDVRAVRSVLDELGLSSIPFDVPARDLALESLRLLDLARAMAHRPQLLMLDEITAALAANQAERVFAVMQRWRDQGRSVLFITHRLAEVLRVCDRATVLRDGRDVAALDPSEGDEDRLVEAMLGAEVAAAVEQPEARAVPEGARVALETRELSSRGRVNGVSISLRSGEILGVAALEGQGQDRLFELLAGDRRPDSGQILVDGVALLARSPYDAIRRGVVLVPSDRLMALLPHRPVKENLSAPLYNRVRSWLRLASDEPTRIAHAIDRLSIDTRAQSQVRRLSGGNQQKVAVGRWLASGFRTLLCFDPTRGIDIGTKRQIYDLLRELAAEGAAVLLYTSELKEIPLVCDRVVVMYGGRIVDEQPAATATEESLLSAAHGLQEPA